MNLSDKQINEIMKLAENFAYAYNFAGEVASSKARVELKEKLVAISKQSDKQEPKLVYEYKWVAITTRGALLKTDFYKTKKEARINYEPPAKVLCRIKQTKREVKDEDND